MHSLNVGVPAASVDAVCDALGELGALSVSVEDADAGSAAETAVFDEPGVGATGQWQRAIVAALFDGETQADAAAAVIVATHGAAGAAIVSSAPLADEDWVRTSQAQFGPIEIVPGFWIVPSWCEVPAGAVRVIRLDPGRAFGTGTHPTTRMCLRWIAAAAVGAPPWQRVLDYGCGSGVLAIAASRYGAADVDAVDIDPAAVEAAAANAATNDARVRCGGTDMASGRYDLVVANILATPLKLLAPLLSSLLAPGGRLLLSGILERQAGELRDAYAAWLGLQVAATDEGWVLMAGRLNGGDRVA
ncbi:MAG: 50S ribosomal protein L11 methyltransferase [Caldimonas sp.]